MAMNPKDLEMRDGGRVPKAKFADSASGPEWASKRRDRRMTHHALHAALLLLGAKGRA